VKKWLCIAAFSAALSSPALAAPGMGDDVAAAAVDAGATTFIARYHRLSDGPAAGEDILRLEGIHGLNERLAILVSADLTKARASSRRVNSFSIEADYYLGKAGEVDFGAQVSYAIGLHGADAIAAKLVIQRTKGPLDMKLNLGVGKALDAAEGINFGYSAAAFMGVHEQVQVGFQAYGDLGGTKRTEPNEGHFIGPVSSFDLGGKGPELELELGYLFAVGNARDNAKGQMRVTLHLGF
jgi:hypothetical protein